MTPDQTARTFDGAIDDAITPSRTQHDRDMRAREAIEAGQALFIGGIVVCGLLAVTLALWG